MDRGMKAIEYHFYRFTPSYHDRNITSIGRETFGTATKVKGYSLFQGGLFNTTYRIQLEHTDYSEQWKMILVPYQ